VKTVLDKSFVAGYRFEAVAWSPENPAVTGLPLQGCGPFWPKKARMFSPLRISAKLNTTAFVGLKVVVAQVRKSALSVGSAGLGLGPVLTPPTQVAV
jgi:hypothetical protein